jgi:hypothetical protein
MTRSTLCTLMFRGAALGLLGSALLGSAVSAQSLGEVAREEQSRRQRVTGGKVYTNTSLPAVEAPPAAAAGAAAQSQAAAGQAPGAATAPAAPGPNDAVKDEPKKDEAWWRKRLQDQREALARAESFAEALQSRINALSTDFVNRDDPAQRNVIAADRQKALLELERVRKEIQEQTKAIADIQQEGRRAGVPAGWLR